MHSQSRCLLYYAVTGCRCHARSSNICTISYVLQSNVRCASLPVLPLTAASLCTSICFLTPVPSLLPLCLLWLWEHAVIRSRLENWKYYYSTNTVVFSPILLHFRYLNADNAFQIFTMAVSYLIFSSVLWHCWLGDRKDIRAVKNWVLVCWWWWFRWSFARHSFSCAYHHP